MSLYRADRGGDHGCRLRQSELENKAGSVSGNRMAKKPTSPPTKAGTIPSEPTGAGVQRPPSPPPARVRVGQPRRPAFDGSPATPRVHSWRRWPMARSKGGTPIRLAKAWQRMGAMRWSASVGRRDRAGARRRSGGVARGLPAVPAPANRPVRRKRNVQYHPNTVVYTAWMAAGRPGESSFQWMHRMRLGQPGLRGRGRAGRHDGSCDVRTGLDHGSAKVVLTLAVKH